MFPDSPNCVSESEGGWKETNFRLKSNQILYQISRTILLEIIEYFKYNNLFEIQYNNTIQFQIQ